MKQKQSLISANFSHFDILGFIGIIAKTITYSLIFSYVSAITGGQVSWPGYLFMASADLRG